MTIEIIQTSQAPDAKPVAISKRLSSSWEEIISVPSYEVPEESFGGGTIVVPGVAEIISPMLVSNITSSTASISIRVFRNEANTHFFIANDFPIAGNDVTPIPLNGQFILTGDILEVQASIVDALDITLSYTVGQAEQDDVV
jgi:hypothetical protein